jgi:hypothetical protein
MAETLVPHLELVQLAKRKQQKNAYESKILVDQLRRTLQAVVQANSNEIGVNAPPLLDKIATIHELDKEIDRQLNNDIALSFEELMNLKSRLQRLIERSNKKLQYDDDNTIVDEMQRRAELIDQELRICELTMELVHK